MTDRQTLYIHPEFWINLVSGKLATYPSPKSAFCPKREVSVNVDLGEGYSVGGHFPETLIDPVQFRQQ